MQIPSVPKLRVPNTYVPSAPNIEVPLPSLDTTRPKGTMPTAITDPLLNLKVRDYYRRNYEQNVASELAGRVSGTAIGAATGYGLGSVIGATVATIGSLISLAVPGDMGSISAASIAAGAKLGSSIGAGVGAGVGAIASDYSTWYATRDIFRNTAGKIFSNPAEAILNSMYTVGKSMDIIQGGEALRASLYSLVKGENVAENILKAYGLHSSGREEYDFERVRESLGIDLGTFPNFVVDMLGEAITDPGLSAVITKMVTSKSSVKSISKVISDNKDVIKIMETSDALQNFAKALSDSKNKKLLKQVASSIQKKEYDTLAYLIASNTKNVISPTDDTLLKIVKKFTDEARSKVSNTITDMLWQWGSAIDEYDDFLTGKLYSLVLPPVGVIKLSSRAKAFIKSPSIADEGFFGKLNYFLLGNKSEWSFEEQFAEGFDKKRSDIMEKWFANKEVESNINSKVLQNTIYKNTKALQKDVDLYNVLTKLKETGKATKADLDELDSVTLKLKSVREILKKTDKEYVDLQISLLTDMLSIKHRLSKLKEGSEEFSKLMDELKSKSEQLKEYQSVLAQVSFLSDVLDNPGIEYRLKSIMKQLNRIYALNKISPIKNVKLKETFDKLIRRIIDMVSESDYNATHIAEFLEGTSYGRFFDFIRRNIDDESKKVITEMFKSNDDVYSKATKPLVDKYNELVNKVKEEAIKIKKENKVRKNNKEELLKVPEITDYVDEIDKLRIKEDQLYQKRATSDRLYKIFVDNAVNINRVEIPEHVKTDKAYKTNINKFLEAYNEIINTVNTTPLTEDQIESFISELDSISQIFSNAFAAGGALYKVRNMFKKRIDLLNDIRAHSTIPNARSLRFVGNTYGGEVINIKNRHKLFSINNINTIKSYIESEIKRLDELSKNPTYSITSKNIIDGKIVSLKKFLNDINSLDEKHLSKGGSLFNEFTKIVDENGNYISYNAATSMLLRGIYSEDDLIKRLNDIRGSFSQDISIDNFSIRVQLRSSIDTLKEHAKDRAIKNKHLKELYNNIITKLENYYNYLNIPASAIINDTKLSTATEQIINEIYTDLDNLNKILVIQAIRDSINKGVYVNDVIEDINKKIIKYTEELSQAVKNGNKKLIKRKEALLETLNSRKAYVLAASKGKQDAVLKFDEEFDKFLKGYIEKDGNPYLDNISVNDLVWEYIVRQCQYTQYGNNNVYNTLLDSEFFSDNARLKLFYSKVSNVLEAMKKRGLTDNYMDTLYVIIRNMADITDVSELGLYADNIAQLIEVRDFVKSSINASKFNVELTIADNKIYYKLVSEKVDERKLDKINKIFNKLISDNKLDNKSFIKELEKNDIDPEILNLDTPIKGNTSEKYTNAYKLIDDNKGVFQPNRYRPKQRTLLYRRPSATKNPRYVYVLDVETSDKSIYENGKPLITQLAITKTDLETGKQKTIYNKYISKNDYKKLTKSGGWFNSNEEALKVGGNPLSDDWVQPGKKYATLRKMQKDFFNLKELWNDDSVVIAHNGNFDMSVLMYDFTKSTDMLDIDGSIKRDSFESLGFNFNFVDSLSLARTYNISDRNTNMEIARMYNVKYNELYDAYNEFDESKINKDGLFTYYYKDDNGDIVCEYFFNGKNLHDAGVDTQVTSFWMYKLLYNIKERLPDNANIFDILENPYNVGKTVIVNHYFYGDTVDELVGTLEYYGYDNILKPIYNKSKEVIDNKNAIYTEAIDGTHDESREIIGYTASIEDLINLNDELSQNYMRPSIIKDILESKLNDDIDNDDIDIEDILESKSNDDIDIKDITESKAYIDIDIRDIMNSINRKDDKIRTKKPVIITTSGTIINNVKDPDADIFIKINNDLDEINRDIETILNKNEAQHKAFIKNMNINYPTASFIKNRNYVRLMLIGNISTDDNLMVLANIFNGEVKYLNKSAMTNEQIELMNVFSHPKMKDNPLLDSTRRVLNNIIGDAIWEDDLLSNFVNNKNQSIDLFYQCLDAAVKFSNDNKGLSSEEFTSKLLFNLQNIVVNSFNEGSYLSNDIIAKIVDRACDKYLAGDNFVLYGNASDFTNVLYDTIKETLLDAIAALKNENKNFKESYNDLYTSINEIFRSMLSNYRSVLSNVKKSNRLNALNPIDLRDFISSTQLRPHELVKNNYVDTLKLSKEVKQSNKIKRLANSLFEDLFKPFDNTQVKFYTSAYETRNVRYLQKIANALNMDFNEFLYVTKNTNYKYINNDLVELTWQDILFNPDHQLYKYVVEMEVELKSLTPDSIGYIKDIEEYKKRIKSIFITNYIENQKLIGNKFDPIKFNKSSAYREGLDISDLANSKLASSKPAEIMNIDSPGIDNTTINAAFQNIHAIKDSNNLFRNICNIYGTNPKKIANFFKSRKDLKLVYMDPKTFTLQLMNVNEYNITSILQSKNLDSFAVMSKDDYFKLVHKTQPIKLPSWLSSLHKYLILPTKLFSLYYSIPFLANNIGSAYLQNVSANGGNPITAISDLVSISKYYNNWKEIYIEATSNKYLWDKFGDSDIINEKWIDFILSGDEDFISTLDTNSSLYKFIKESSEKDREMLLKINEYSKTAATYSEIIDVQRNVNISKKKSEQLDALTKRVNNGTADSDEILEYNVIRDTPNDGFENIQKEYEYLKTKKDKNRYDYRRMHTLKNRLDSRFGTMMSKIYKYTGLQKWLDINADIENIFRMAMMDNLTKQGADLSVATNEVIRRHFIYNDKSEFDRLLEVFMPFSTYPIKAAKLFTDLTDDASFVKMMYLYNKYSWGDEDESRSEYLQKRKVKGDIPINNQLLGLGNAFTESLYTLMNPLEAVNNKLNPLLKPMVDLATNAQYNRITQLPLVSQGANIYESVESYKQSGTFNAGRLLGMTRNYYSYENNYYNRPRYPQRSYLYKNLYTKGGYSRVSMGMQQTTLDNLHYRVNDILYKTRYRHK